MNLSHRNTYKSSRIPVYARNAVAASHPLASQAGLRMIWKGGNAVDAAIAAAAVMTVVEPVSNGLGSDAFCILWDGKELHGLNASGCAPMAWSPEYFHAKYGDGQTTPPKRGADSITVPGAVGAWAALHERFGKLSFDELMEPAAEIAERGYLVPPVVQEKWEACAPELLSQPGFAETFLLRGRVPNVGEHFTFASAAKALRSIGETKGRSFYEGEIAQRMVSHIQASGGSMSLMDLAANRPQWVTPISKDYRGHTLHEIPPNGQGIAALMTLGILSNFDMSEFPVDSVQSQHVQIEAMKLAFADIQRYVADPRYMEVTAQELLDDAYLASRAKLIDLGRAQDVGAGNPVKGGTIYLTAADESGMMVSFIQSNYAGFGSGIVEPHFGISLQNRGWGFSTDPSGPNKANLVAPGKRPFHTIIPAFVTKDGQPVMSFGVMGGNMQPQGHVQTLVRMLDHGQGLQAACDAPRWRFNAGMEVNLEPGMAPEIESGLSKLGHSVKVFSDPYLDYGAGQYILRAGDPAREGYVAASDPRRDGLVAGF